MTEQKTSFINNLKNDLPASIVVFLVALPLCLGVALASNAPLMSGIIAGIIGGIVVGLFSGSHTSVSGPAAGLSAIVAGAIMQTQSLPGGFQAFLLAVVLAGFLQILIGVFKGGFIASYIPSSVVKGLLAAIGIILILKQLPHAVGYDKDSEGEMSFEQIDGQNTFSELVNMLDFLNFGAISIALIAILILVYWHKTPFAKLKYFPASLFVVLFGAIVNLTLFPFFETQLGWSNWIIHQPEHLVKLPDVALLEIGKHLNFPYFAQILNPQIWIIAMTIALIASLETLLGIEAVDAIDNLKRKTPVNRELIAQGIGNMCSGLIGGIPVTSVIVRSSANINSGAVSKLSTILHGVFLLLSLLVFSNYLNYIPLAALAAILITTGYKLAKISLFKEMWEKGYGQFLPFLATIVGIVLTDLLKGVFIGLAVSLFFVLRSSFKSPFSLRSEVRYVGEVIKLKLPSQVSFFNKNALQKLLEQQPINSQLEIDGSDTFFLDHDTSELIKSFRDVFAINKNIKLNIVGFKGRYQNLNQQNIRTSLDAQTRSLLAPEQIVHLLQEGNKRFVEGTSSEAKKNYKTQADELVAGQSPMAVVLGCMDSRAIPEVLFDTAIGDILTIRVAGNIIGPSELSSLEIAVKKLGAKVILIKGHSNCGAVSLAIANITDDNIAFTTEKIRRSVEQCGLHFNEAITSSNVNDNPLMMQAVINQNTKNSIMDIIYSSSYLNNQIVQGNVKIIGAYHDIATGLVHFDSEDLV